MKRIKQFRSTSAVRREETVVKNFHQYVGPGGQILHGYVRRYKNVRLRKKGFTSKAEAERHLRQAMNDIDAEERGEIRCKPTPDLINWLRPTLKVNRTPELKIYLPPQNKAVYVLISASKALVYSWPLLRERWEQREHREQLTRLVNLWKSRRLRYHSRFI